MNPNCMDRVRNSEEAHEKRWSPINIVKKRQVPTCVISEERTPNHASKQQHNTKQHNWSDCNTAILSSTTHQTKPANTAFYLALPLVKIPHIPSFGPHPFFNHGYYYHHFSTFLLSYHSLFSSQRACSKVFVLSHTSLVCLYNTLLSYCTLATFYFIILPLFHAMVERKQHVHWNCIGRNEWTKKESKR